MRRVWEWAAVAGFGLALVAAPAAGQTVLPPATTAPPETTAPPTTAPPATEAPPETTAPPTTNAPPTTRKPAPTTTTIAATTTTPEQLPTLPPLPEGQVPGPTTTAAPKPADDAARVSPVFPALSVGGLLVALLILVVTFLWNSRRSS